MSASRGQSRDKEDRAEREERKVPGDRPAEVVADMVDAQHEVVDEALTRVAGDNWREFLAFVAPQGYEHPSRRGVI